MSVVAAAARVELARALRPRWVLLTAVGTLAYLGAVAPGWRPIVDVPFNMWDVVMEVSAIPPTLHLMVAWSSLMASEILIEREDLGVDALLAARCKVASRWWAKSAAIVVVGLLVGVLVWVLATAVGALATEPALTLSEWGRSPYDPLGSAIEQVRPHGPPPLGAAPYVGTAVVFGYQGFAVGLYVALVASIVQRLGRPWVCPLVAVATSVAGQIAGLSAVNPAAQMIWLVHLPAPDGYLPWITVAPVALSIGAIVALFGPRGIRFAQGRAR